MKTDSFFNDWADGKQFVVADSDSTYAAYRRWCISAGASSLQQPHFAALLQNLRLVWQQLALRLVLFVRKGR